MVNPGTSNGESSSASDRRKASSSDEDDSSRPRRVKQKQSKDSPSDPSDDGEHELPAMDGMEVNGYDTMEDAEDNAMGEEKDEEEGDDEKSEDEDHNEEEEDKDKEADDEEVESEANESDEDRSKANEKAREAEEKKVTNEMILRQNKRPERTKAQKKAGKLEYRSNEWEDDGEVEILTPKQPQAKIWKEIAKRGMVEDRITVGGVVGRRICHHAAAGKTRNDYHFWAEVLWDWSQHPDHTMKIDGNGPLWFARGDVQYKVYDANNPSMFYWRYADEIFNCGDMIKELYEQLAEQIDKLEIQRVENELKREEERVTVAAATREPKALLMAAGNEGRPAVPHNYFHSSSGDESDESEDCARVRPFKANDRTQEAKIARRAANNEEHDPVKTAMGVETERQRLRRECEEESEREEAEERRRDQPFGTRREEDAMVRKPTDEQLVEYAYKLWRARDDLDMPARRAAGIIMKTEEEMRDYYEEGRTAYVMYEIAKEKWAERKEAILERRERERRGELQYFSD